MNKYTRIIEDEIKAVQGYIERHKGVGAYYDNCQAWGHHLVAYHRILELITTETERAKTKATPQSA